jgi:hypothetical protein
MRKSKSNYYEGQTVYCIKPDGLDGAYNFKVGSSYTIKSISEQSIISGTKVGSSYTIKSISEQSIISGTKITKYNVHYAGMLSVSYTSSEMKKHFITLEELRKGKIKNFLNG